MALRRREKRTERSKIDATPPWDAKQREKPQATTGPYDVLDAPDDDIPRIDLGGYAAPRNEGIWEEVRAEIRTSLIEQGGGGKDREDSPFGTELVGTLKVDGKPTPVRFIGVDGPRWFLRGMFVGDIASQALRAEPFERILRQIVVVRGSNPLPVREPVVLELPKEAIPTADDGSDEDASTF